MMSSNNTLEYEYSILLFKDIQKILKNDIKTNSFFCLPAFKKLHNIIRELLQQRIRGSNDG